MRSFKATKTEFEDVDRNLAALEAAVADLQAAAVAAKTGGGGRVATYETSGTIGDEMLAVYRGPGSHTLTLPGAAQLGAQICRLLLIWNDSANALTIAATSGDTYGDSTTVSAGAKALFGSDGATKVFRVI